MTIKKFLARSFIVASIAVALTTVAIVAPFVLVLLGFIVVLIWAVHNV